MHFVGTGLIFITDGGGGYKLHFNFNELQKIFLYTRFKSRKTTL